MFVDRIAARTAPVRGYACGLPVTRCLAKQRLWLRSPVTIFTGDNGSGKSTLIEALACKLGFNAEGGRQFEFLTTEWTTSELHKGLVVVGSETILGGYFLRAETHYNVSPQSRIRSHGESIMDVVEDNFFHKWLYILDEPEAGLSPIHQMALLGYIHRIAAGGGQFIIATHSPIILGIPGADIIHITPAGFQRMTFDDHPLYRNYASYLGV